MSNEPKAGSEPQNKEGNFDDMVGKEQPVNKIDGSPAKPAEEEPQKPGPEGKKPEGEPAAPSGEKKGEGEKLFWDKFKSEDEAKHSYDEAQTKITEQGQEMSKLKTASEENEKFLSSLDKALAKNPELANQLKAALAEVVKASKGSEEGGEETDLDTLIDKKFEEREVRAKTKAEIDAWFEKHPEVNESNAELGHKILDMIEKEKLPFSAKTLQLVYDALTKETSVEQAKKKAADEALKKEEVAELDREEASAVGGGSPQAKGKVPQENPFDDLVGESVNPNKVRV